MTFAPRPRSGNGSLAPGNLRPFQQQAARELESSAIWITDRRSTPGFRVRAWRAIPL
jgi:hypothetical protein